MLKSFLDSLFSLLGLRLPLIISIKRKQSSNDGYYMGKFNNKGELIGHRITIYLNGDTARSLEAIIAHELVHAWQAENGDIKPHGPRFARKAKRIEKKYNLHGVYLKEIDTP